MFQGIKKLFGGKKEEGQILAPVAGQAVPLSEVPDPAFAQEILGKGVAILPSENEFKAPASGEVTVLFETGHAVSIRTESGADVIVHIGLTIRISAQRYAFFWLPGRMMPLRNTRDGRYRIRMPAMVKLSLRA